MYQSCLKLLFGIMGNIVFFRVWEVIYIVVSSVGFKYGAKVKLRYSVSSVIKTLNLCFLRLVDL